MQDLKFLAYSTKTGGYIIFALTTAVLIINIVALFIHNKSNYRCPCFKKFVASVLMSTCMASLICNMCNIVLVFIVHGMSPSWIKNLYKTLSLFSDYTEYVCIVHILLISFQRYIAVVFPFKLTQLWILCNANGVITIIWGVLFVIFIPLAVVNISTQHNISDIVEQVQAVIIICIIPVLIFYYTKIVYTLMQRVRKVKLSSTSANVRGAATSLALGCAFVLTFLPSTIHRLFYPDYKNVVWPLYIYIISYAFDSLLIIFKYLAEKHLKTRSKINTGEMSTKSSDSRV